MNRISAIVSVCVAFACGGLVGLVADDLPTPKKDGPIVTMEEQEDGDLLRDWIEWNYPMVNAAPDIILPEQKFDFDMADDGNADFIIFPPDERRLLTIFELADGRKLFIDHKSGDVFYEDRKPCFYDEAE